MKKNVSIILFLVLVVTFAAGCGETVSGMSRDIKRIGKGTKTVFFRQE